MRSQALDRRKSVGWPAEGDMADYRGSERAEKRVLLMNEEHKDVSDEILKNAKWRVDHGEQLSSVESTMLAEYIARARARLKVLETLGTRGTRVQKLERKRLVEEVDKYGKAV